MAHKNKNFIIALSIAVVISVIIGIAIVSINPETSVPAPPTPPAETANNNAASNNAQPAEPPKKFVRSRTVVSETTFTSDYIEELQSQGFTVQRGKGTNRYVAEKNSTTEDCQIKRIIAWNDVGNTVRNVSRATQNECN